MASRRSVTLDVLRGCSALLIVLFHYTTRYNQYPENADVQYVFPATVWWGYAAVVTFFMLSGYLVAPLLVSGAQPGKFLWHKAKRLYPAYWVSMTITSLVLLGLYAGQSIGIGQYFANLTMVSTLFGVPFVDGVYWSMQVELMFCLLVAWGFVMQKKVRLSTLLLIWIILALVLNVFPVKPLKFARILFISDYAQYFVAGITVRALNQKAIGNTEALILIALCLVTSALRFGIVSTYTAFFALTLAALWFVDTTDRVISGNNIVVRVFAWVAAISYPLYLVHSMVGFAIMRHLHVLGWQHWSAIIIPISVALLLACAVHYLVERRR